MRRLLIVVVVVTTLAGCGGDDSGSDDEPSVTTTEANEVALEDIVVQADEVSSLGLSLDEEGAQTQSEFFPTSNFGGPLVKAAIDQAGFVDAYVRSFGDVATVPSDAIGSVRGAVVQVEDAAQAQQVLDALVAGVREGNELGGGGDLSDVSEVSGLGDAAQTYTATFSSPPPLVSNFVYWRSGSYVLSISTVAGPSAQDPESLTQDLASTMQARLDG